MSAKPLTLAKKGNKGGRPTKEEADFKQKLKQVIEREAKRRVKKIARRYMEMAQGDPATMRHLIDKTIAPAKQEIALDIGCYRIDAFDPNNPDKKRRGT